MAAPIVYRFDDGGAPILSGVDNTKLISLLKACLVDGYGAKPAAGWTMPYINSDGDMASFRNNPVTGTGFYLNVRKNNSKNTMSLAGYESMTSETEGVNQFGNNYIYTSGDTTNTARPWILFADDRFLHFHVWFYETLNNINTKQGYLKSFCFGDCIPLEQSDNYFCVLTFSAPSNTSSQGCYYLNHPDVATRQYYYVARNIAGDVQANRQFALIHGGGPRGTGDSPGNSNRWALPRTIGSEIISRPYVNNSITYSIRGYMPGLWIPCHPASDFNNFEQLEIGGHRFIIVKTADHLYTQSVFAIDVSEHWRP